MEEGKRSHTDEELISLYEERPILWDNRLKEYHDRNSKVKALSEIAEVMKLTVPQVKKKVHSLRTSFTNERRRLAKKKSGQALETKKPSQKYEALKFLDVVITHSIKTQSNMDSEENESMFEIDESVYNESETQTQIGEIVDEQTISNEQDLSNDQLNRPSVIIASTPASVKSLPQKKRKRLNQIAAAEQENAAIDATLKFLTNQSRVTNDLLNQKQKQSSSTSPTSSFASYLDSMMKCLTDVERGELEIDVLNFVHKKKKEIFQNRVKYLECVTTFEPIQSDLLLENGEQTMTLSTTDSIFD